MEGKEREHHDRRGTLLTSDGKERRKEGLEHGRRDSKREEENVQ